MIFAQAAAPSLSRYEDLELLLAHPPDRPQTTIPEQYSAWSAEDRRTYDTMRLDYLGGGLTVATPQVQALIKTVRLAILGNRGRAAGRTGVMVSGQSTVGKTTACIALMRSVHTLYYNQYPHSTGTGVIPVAYVEVPAGSSAKAMIGRFAHFYGLELPRSGTLEQILNAVVHAMRACSTQLVVVDELQNLNSISHGNGESVDVLKSLSNQVPATFVYSGINLLQGGLLAGERGNQISRRFTMLEMRRYGHATPEEKRVWNGIVMAFSNELMLMAHKKEHLLKASSWLHKRSGGNIGTLQRIMVGGAQLLILGGNADQECLDREYMETIPVDIAAERAAGSTIQSSALSQLVG